MVQERHDKRALTDGGQGRLDRRLEGREDGLDVRGRGALGGHGERERAEGDEDEEERDDAGELHRVGVGRLEIMWLSEGRR